jgi:archaellum component FlaF (FlaF/FlaG flagellin family)
MEFLPEHWIEIKSYLLDEISLLHLNTIGSFFIYNYLMMQKYSSIYKQKINHRIIEGYFRYSQSEVINEKQKMIKMIYKYKNELLHLDIFIKLYAFNQNYFIKKNDINLTTTYVGQKISKKTSANIIVNGEKIPYNELCLKNNVLYKKNSLLKYPNIYKNYYKNEFKIYPISLLEISKFETDYDYINQYNKCIIKINNSDYNCNKILNSLRYSNMTFGDINKIKRYLNI